MNTKILGIGLAIVAPLLTWNSFARACTVDTDCPGTACGTDICSYNTTPPSCVSASEGKSSSWCTLTTDCKCVAQGATCETVNCSITEPPEAGATEAGTAEASTGTTDSSTTVEDTGTKTTSGDTGTTVPSDAGTTGPTSTDTSTTTSTTTEDASTTATASSSSSSGCSLAALPLARPGSWVTLGFVGLGIAGLRRRRRS